MVVHAFSFVPRSVIFGLECFVPVLVGTNIIIPSVRSTLELITSEPLLLVW
jgi:hypothetical protein